MFCPIVLNKLHIFHQGSSLQYAISLNIPGIAVSNVKKFLQNTNCIFSAQFYRHRVRNKYHYKEKYLLSLFMQRLVTPWDNSDCNKWSYYEYKAVTVKLITPFIFPTNIIPALLISYFSRQIPWNDSFSEWACSLLVCLLISTL